MNVEACLLSLFFCMSLKVRFINPSTQVVGTKKCMVPKSISIFCSELYLLNFGVLVLFLSNLMIDNWSNMSGTNSKANAWPMPEP